MSQNTAPESQADADRLEAAADEAIAVCGGDVRAALKAMIVANEFLESEVSELMKDPFIADLMPFMSQLDGLQMSSVLAQVRDLTLRPRRSA